MVVKKSMRLLLRLQNLIGNSVILRWLDKKVCVSDYGSTPEPIFIIGAPRVGSTVLFQSLIAKYQMAYFSNIHSFFFSQPCLADIFVRTMRFCGFRHNHSLKSNFGFTSGMLGPSEAGSTFRYWFGDADFSLKYHVTDRRQVISAVATLSKAAKAPLISKNLFNSMRLKEILECFPNAFLVWMQRDHISTAQSILKMRRSIHGTEKKWVSVGVPNQQDIQQLPPEKQVRRQIVEIENYIEDIFSCHSKEKKIIVQYNSFCLNPEKIMDDIVEAYSQFSACELLVRDTFERSLLKNILIR